MGRAGLSAGRYHADRQRSDFLGDLGRPPPAKLLAGIALFTAASVLCGVASTLGLLIAARAAQGLGAAVMMALVMALVGDAVPKARTGRAMGLLGTMSALGTMLGPSLGGVLIAGFGWPAMFLVNVPLGVAAFLLVRCGLPADRRDPTGGQAGFDRARHVAAGRNARGIRARRDARPWRFRQAQPRAAVGRGAGRRAVRICRDSGRCAVDPPGAAV